MTTDTNQNVDEATNVKTSGAGDMTTQAEEFLSLRDILIMILRHRWKITIFVLLITILAGVLFLLSPRSYKAEGYLQVIPPVSIEGRVDKNLFETTIISHLQKVRSAFVAQRVADMLRTEGIEIDVIKLQNNVKISRPPKTDLIRVVASGSSPEMAVSIVCSWVQQYLDSVSENYITVALSHVCALLKKAQADVAAKRGAVSQVKSRAAEVGPLVTLSRAVDDQQLWKELAEKVEPESLKQLADIHIKGQEESSEYLTLKAVLLHTERDLASALANRDFYQEVERILEAELASVGSSGKAESDAPSEGLSDANRYVKSVLRSIEIIQFGEPALMSSSRGALKKTSLVFVVSLFLACVCVFTVEWLKGSEF